jgi:hypothetical protein
MSDFGKELKMYAEIGLRSVQAWLTMSRTVVIGSDPRASVICRGQAVQLFTRDQTRAHSEAQAR